MTASSGGVEGFVLPGESGNGLLVPIDINGDGLSEIIKGIDGFARLYVREGENWSLLTGTLTLMKIQVLLATGDSDLLKEVASIPTNQVSAQIATGDFDGDSIMDLAVASGLNEGTLALRGLGDGQFATPVHVVPDGRRVLAGDYDGDGRDELITNRYTDGVIAYVWFVDAVLNDPTLHQVDGANASLLASADIHADGVDDIAVRTFMESPSQVTILLSDP